MRLSALFVLTLALFLPSSSAAAASGERWVSHPVEKFDILATEATVAEFKTCVAAKRCDPDSVSEECNAGKEGRDAHPVNCINHDGAVALCSYLGGRLCSSKEWLAACRGSDNRAFPYGPEYQESRCHVGSYASPGPGGKTTVEAGSIPACEGGLPGVFDLSGNVSEWVSDCKEDYCKFRGAAYVGNEPVDYFAGCGQVCSGNDKSLKSGTVGVRCCRDR